MNAIKLGTILVAAVVLVGGIGAVGLVGAAEGPADNASVEDAPGPANQTGDQASNASEHAGNVSEDRPGSVGPPGDLPAQAADHVSEIHDRIESFLGGSIDHLGDAIDELRD